MSKSDVTDLQSSPLAWWISPCHHSTPPLFLEGSLKHSRSVGRGEPWAIPSFSVPLACNVLGGHNGKHPGPIWFDKMFSPHCAQGLHKAEGSRDYDSWIVNQSSEPPLRGRQELQWLSAMKNWPSITICYSYTVKPYYSIMRSVYYTQIPFRKSSFALFNKCSIHILSNVVDCLFIKMIEKLSLEGLLDTKHC